MRHLFLPLSLLLIGAAAPAEPRWERIFDGRSLAGWTPKITGQAAGEDALGMFVVRGGAIRVSHANYRKFAGEFGHLFWNTPLKAYRLRLDYRFFSKSLPGIADWQTSNSGVMIDAQAPQTMARDQQFPVSLEVQLLGSPRPAREPTGNLCTPGTTVVFAGKRDLRHCILSSGPILPNGRWVRAEVEVLPDGRITHRIDGKIVLTYSAPELDPADADAKPLIEAAGGALALRGGYIAVQSEGHPVEFRNIEVQRLD
ncbi:DUF1080 domain-containing protein [uncultured Sphingomonas sp.]|uniref:3-keto-disaccharide hydrolase n=1 Tax=uncultured Sphingomonas sp. TaxID=158754 RepID=UPI0025DEBED0|nr:DUF1080 domain-containing protein [uncultured Sphingomonas sp.]